MYDSVAMLRTTVFGLEAILEDLDRVETSSAAALHVQWAIDLLKQDMAAIILADRGGDA